MKAALLLVAFVAGGVLTWLLTVHRETREVGPDASDPTDPTDATDSTEATRSSEESEATDGSEGSEASDASGFGGSRSGESSGRAGSRWMADAQDEDALLPDATGPSERSGRSASPPPA